MTHTEKLNEQGDQLGLPWDLREWFGEFTLLQWIENEVESLEWGNQDLQDFLKAHPEFHPRLSLVLLTYAYATATYDSDEIVDGCYADATLRGICGGVVPTKKEHMAFRRENRGLLRLLLAQLFQRAIRDKFDLRDAMPGGLKKRLEEAATTRIDMARHLDRGPHGD